MLNSIYNQLSRSSQLGASLNQSISSVSPTSNRTKIVQDTPTPTDSFSSSMTSGTGTLRPYLPSNCSSFVTGQNPSISSNITIASPTSTSGGNEGCDSRYIFNAVLKDNESASIKLIRFNI